jgi:hypothetical protein
MPLATKDTLIIIGGSMPSSRHALIVPVHDEKVNEQICKLWICPENCGYNGRMLQLTLAFSQLIIDLFQAFPLVTQIKLTGMFLILYCDPLLMGILLSLLMKIVLSEAPKHLCKF